MQTRWVGAAVLLLSGVAAASGSGAAAAQVAAGSGPTIQVVRQIDRQDIAARAGSEPDTLVEPDIAANPLNSRQAVAVAHDSRFADGGAVAISYTWTSNGGVTWHHAPVPQLTKATGGRWPRASDPVLAWAPDGSLYLSALVFYPYACPTGVAVLRSTDGGRTWGRPVLADYRTSCTFSDDKNWIVVDSNATSPHFGRIYQFWTPFLFTAGGRYIGSPQAVRWSDDNGRNWSAAHFVNGRTESSQDSQPMVLANGTVVDAYESFRGGGHDQPEQAAAAHRLAAARAERPSVRAASDTGIDLVVRRSRDGGATWSGPITIVRNIGEGPRDVRCCLPSAATDPVADELVAAWIGADRGMPVEFAFSFDGVHWSLPQVVSRDGSARTTEHINVDVTAYADKVFVSYGTRSTLLPSTSSIVQQMVNWSYDGGFTFGRSLALGPPSDLNYAAFAGAAFPGDYIGSSATADRVYLAWAVSSHIAHMVGPYHQTLYGAVLTP